MAIVGLITLVVCVIGLIGYLALTGFARASVVEVCRIAFAMGLLGFCIASGAQSCSVGTGGASSSAPARR